ncbi:MAG: type II toxin-antitoxin system RatA family toxin [Gammaproteobacteria bacterium]|nr:type II toxin-antitoxin system RatA family toxin [Gammaproteobacteria bacterium]
MEIVRKKMWTPYAREAVYALIADIESYAGFLPWCAASKVLHRWEGGVEASLTLKKGGLSKTFVTRNLETVNEKIEMHLLSGPFKHLYGVWKFEDKNKGVEVSLDLEFSFDNRLVAMMIGPLFQPVANSLLEAFMQRAADVCQKK